MDNRFVRNAKVEAAPMKEETVLFNPANNKFCVLNPTAALIWNALETPRTLPEIVLTVSERYSSADPARIERDVQQAIEELRSIECVGVA